MIKIKCKWKIQWDYFGYSRLAQINGYNPYTQKDWNETLSTKLNQISAQIFQATLRGGASYIMVNDKVFKLLKTLEYWNNDEQTVNNRFKVIVNNLIHKDVIYLFSKELYQNPKDILIPLTNNKVSNEIDLLKKCNFIWNGTYRYGDYLSKEELKRFKKTLIGKVTIKNYEG